MPSDKRRVACIGVGNVGRAWALVFARADFRVSLYDAADGAVEEALRLLRRNADDLEAAGRLQSATQTMERIHPAATLAEAVADACHVQESVREDRATKAAVFEEIAKAAPLSASLASSTSALPGSTFLEHIATRERCLVAHPVNPPSLIPLVELCPTPWTAPETVAAVRALMREVGQHPVVLKKEVPGFLLNRLQYTLVGEALHLIGEGYCDPEDIDAVLTQGLALRWVLYGPLEVAHLNATKGFAGFVEQLGDMMRTVGEDAQPDYAWDESLIEQIHARLARQTPVDAIGNAQVERDRRIMSLLNWRDRVE